jgi:hypothetical protein
LASVSWRWWDRRAYSPHHAALSRASRPSDRRAASARRRSCSSTWAASSRSRKASARDRSPSLPASARSARTRSLSPWRAAASRPASARSNCLLFEDGNGGLENPDSRGDVTLFRRPVIIGGLILTDRDSHPGGAVIAHLTAPLAAEGQPGGRGGADAAHLAEFRIGQSPASSLLSPASICARHPCHQGWRRDALRAAATACYGLHLAFPGRCCRTAAK